MAAPSRTNAGGAAAPAVPRPRRVPAAAAATAAAAAATPLPILPFFAEFRAQVARLEGVAPLPWPKHVAEAQREDPSVSFRSGACHADRLRYGHFVHVTATEPGKQRRSSASGGSRNQNSSGSGSSVSVLQGTLLPSLFSFHPPLEFQVLAYGGGERWMVSVDYVPLASTHGWEGSTGQKQPSSSSGSTSSTSTSSGAGPTPAVWQQQQAARLVALRGMHIRAAVPLPSAALRPTSDGWPSPSHLLLSSEQLQGESTHARRAALHGAALPAFRAALSVHLNGLAAAPADAAPDHVQRTAAAQRRYLLASGRRPLLCTAQLTAAFGAEWVQEMQEHLLAASVRGLPEQEVQLAGSASQQQQQQQRQQQLEHQDQQQQFVYFNPAFLASQDDG